MGAGRRKKIQITAGHTELGFIYENATVSISLLPVPLSPRRRPYAAGGERQNCRFAPGLPSHRPSWPLLRSPCILDHLDARHATPMPNSAAAAVELAVKRRPAKWSSPRLVFLAQKHPPPRWQPIKGQRPSLARRPDFPICRRH